jgi:hypothetical protein
LSRSIDALSVEADKLKDPVLKSIALFFAMTLYGEVEKHISSVYQPALLFGERHCVIDTLAYSHFYIPLLSASRGPKKNYADLIQNLLGSEELATLEAWLKVISLRDPSIPLNLECISEFMIQVCQGTPQEIMHRLLKIYRADIPDQVVLLTTSPEGLARRLKEKKASGNEIHEQTEVLLRVARSLKRTLELLKEVNPKLIVHEVNTETMGIQQTIDTIFQLSQETQGVS